MTLSRLRREEAEAQARLDEVRLVLRDTMKTLEETRAEYEAIQEQTEMMAKRRNTMAGELASLRKEHTALEQELSELETEHGALEVEIDNFNIKKIQCKQEAETLEKDLIYLRFKASQEHEAYENTITSYATQQSEKERQILQLNAEIAQLEAKKAQIEGVLHMHATNMAQDKVRIDEEWAKIREREQVVDQRAEDARMLRHRLKRFCAEKKIVFPIADE